mmetsp:Transcript_27041/g.84979  ORF Transcript_27041/g.84979 Transcript_27041/m.84979 type:complete len:118 (-) Transcript_27041:586-939(-)
MAGRRALFVFGAGTDVGKSVLSAALARSAANLLGAAHVRYIKPVQTGGAEIDAESTRSAAGVAVATETLFAWKTPVTLSLTLSPLARNPNPNPNPNPHPSPEPATLTLNPRCHRTWP